MVIQLCNSYTYVSKVSPSGINTVTFPPSGVCISADDPANLNTSPTNITFLPTNFERLFPKTRGSVFPEDYKEKRKERYS